MRSGTDLRDDPADQRETAYAALDRAHGSVVPRRWRLVLTDTESLTGFGPVCPSAERSRALSPDLGHDVEDAYDCCPRVVETFSEPLAAFLVELLNRDGATHPDPGHCGRAGSHDAHEWAPLMLRSLRLNCTGREL